MSVEGAINENRTFESWQQQKKEDAHNEWNAFILKRIRG